MLATQGRSIALMSLPFAITLAGWTAPSHVYLRDYPISRAHLADTHCFLGEFGRSESQARRTMILPYTGCFALATPGLG
jgi:hypothetical protein